MINDKNMGFFAKGDKETKYLGIDIGGSSIKLVELQNNNGRAQLSTYGYLERSIKSAGQSLLDNPTEMANAIKKVVTATKVTAKTAVTALPASSVFSTIINLTEMARNDLGSIKTMTTAIEAEAKKVLPLPIEEMVIDWKLLGSQTTEGSDRVKNVQILLTAAAKSLIQKYIEIFKKADLNLLSLETESFALARTLVGKDKAPAVIVDIGSANTDITVVENGLPYLERTVNVGGYHVTKALAETLGVTVEQAEQFKRDLENYSDQLPGGKLLPPAIEKIMGAVINEVKYLMNFYKEQPGNEAKRIDRIILSGGTARIFNLPEYFTKIFNVRTFLGDPWARVLYPDDLRPALDSIGSRLGVAIGLAMREIEK